MGESTGPIDLTAELAAAYAALPADRGDEAEAHVSDISGLCYREAWARRKGLPRSPLSLETRIGFDLGHETEKFLLTLLFSRMRAQGKFCYYGPTIELWFDGQELHSTYNLDGGAVIRPSGAKTVIGHADGFIIIDGKTRIVIDTKSTVGFQTRDAFGQSGWKPKGDVKYSHLLQVACYGVALRAQWGVIWELDLGSKQLRQEWIKIEDWKERVREGVVEALALTDPTKPEPPAEPHEWTYNERSGKSWACGHREQRRDAKTGEHVEIVKRGYCRYTACPSHVSYGSEVC